MKKNWLSGLVVTASMIAVLGIFFTELGCTMRKPFLQAQPYNSGDSSVGNNASNNLPEFTQTASGLKYRILKHSNRPHPRATDKVTVHYKGWLDDNTVFDSSYSKGPATFPLNKVVPAWTEGVPLVGIGGTIELEVPPHLGYGKRGSPGKIPPNATLHFQIELIDIE